MSVAPEIMAEEQLLEYRRAEQARYAECYKKTGYRMNELRFVPATAELDAIVELAGGDEWSLLDVGCGRGEIIKHAFDVGFLPVVGTEVVDYLCTGSVCNAEVTSLPFHNGDFDVVTCFDVLEHIPAEDTVLALQELHRVARKAVLVTVSNTISCWQDDRGDLHINKRPYAEWHALFLEYWPGTVEHRVSQPGTEMWRVIK